MKAILLPFCCLLFFSAFSQGSNDLPGRKGFTLILPVDKTYEYTDSIKAGPYIVHEGIIQIYPGESIYVEVEESNGSIKSMKTVKENLNPAKTISISLTQIAENHVHQSMMLKINNPFTKDLTYSVKNFLMKSNRWVGTDVLPVAAGLSSFESWPDLIVTMALFDWKFTSK
jgi:hypothetical protein